MNTNEKPSYDILNRKLLQFSFHRATLKSLQNALFNRGVKTKPYYTNLVSLCVSWILCDSYFTVLYTNDLISELSGHYSAPDFFTQSDLSNTYAQRDIFTG